MFSCKFVLFIAVLLTVVLCSVAATTEQLFQVVTNKDGNYTVRVGDATWLTSGRTFFRYNGVTYSSTDGTLKPVGPLVLLHGSDDFGPWNASTFLYAADRGRVETSVRIYEKYSVAIFEQNFLSKFGGQSTGDENQVVSGFPSFLANSSSPLGFLAYSDLFAGWINLKTGRWNGKMERLGDGLASGPLLLFDEKGNTIVISPFDRFMAASYYHDTARQTLSWGIMGKVDNIPTGFSYSTIVFFDNKGINKAVENWGLLMRKWYRRDTASRDLDLSINYIGYYTDNGGYYYQVPEKGMNFEDTLLGVFNYSTKNGIPYRYLQYDDWFYPTVGPTDYGATVTWDAKPSVFPHGLVYLYNKTKLPVVAHNRYWSDKTPYAKQNGGRFNFVFDGKGNSLPDDQAFWDELFSIAKMWGLVTYEQDWLNYQIENIAPVQTDLTLGTRWLHQMGESAQRYGLTLQYCMSLPRHVLSALEIPSVSQVRASNDYMPKTYQYRIGISSIFISAVGLAPFKDNFWTVTNEPGNRWQKTEPNPKLEAVIALLSCGPVGISDKIGYTDVQIARSLATASGLLVKPSRPATAIDAQILEMAFGDGVGPKGEVWTTYSEISGFIFGVILAMDMTRPYTLKVEEGNWGSEFPTSIGYSSEYFMPSTHGASFHFDSTSPLLLTNCTSYTDWCFYYTSPLFRVGDLTYYIKGEMNKTLPISPKRISSISSSTEDLIVQMTGTPGEPIDFVVCQADGPHFLCKTYPCVISSAGSAYLSVTDDACHGDNE